MSGHSKWSSIKHQKGVTDARRGQLFTKLTREIIVVVREGGSDPSMNARLRLAIQKAKDNSMPSDNIERAIKKGSGTLEGTILEEMVLEGYDANGAAILVKALSDNRNRTIQDVRHMFSRHGGSLGESGCVAWLFDSKGLIMIKTEYLATEELALETIDAGADDVSVWVSFVEVEMQFEELERVRKAVDEKRVHIDTVARSRLPSTRKWLGVQASLQTLKLLDKLEEMDDVQQVSTNVDFPDSVLERFQGEART